MRFAADVLRIFDLSYRKIVSIFENFSLNLQSTHSSSVSKKVFMSGVPAIIDYPLSFTVFRFYSSKTCITTKNIIIKKIIRKV